MIRYKDVLIQRVLSVKHSRISEVSLAYLREFRYAEV